jgi:hypothetical protein
MTVLALNGGRSSVRVPTNETRVMAREAARHLERRMP